MQSEKDAPKRRRLVLEACGDALHVVDILPALEHLVDIFLHYGVDVAQIVVEP